MTRHGTTRLVVGVGLEGLRIDQLIAHSTNLSRRKAREIIADGAVWLNQQPIRILSRTVGLADVVDVLVPGADLGAPARPQLDEISILHEDRWLLVANKPAGVLSQPIRGSRSEETAFDQRVALVIAARDGRPRFLRMLHRLDRLTSGAVLFAACQEALAPLSRLWSEARVGRTYLAVAQGHIEEDEREIEIPVARDPSRAWRFRPSASGRHALTRIKVLARQDREASPGEGLSRRGCDEVQGRLSIVSCELVTGRTHQVRVHLAAIGHPVIGDKLYGGPTGPAATRPLLHAAALALPHPRTGRLLQIGCPLPDDIEAWVPRTVSSALLPPG